MRSGERGSALILAVLVMVILTLLGISFLLLAETENRIAENERLASQALYFAEAGTRAVLQWFNDPKGANNLVNPPLAALDRTRRQVDDDGDPATAALTQDGVTWPRYKQGIDLDHDGEDDVFDRPYRRSNEDTFRGVELGNGDDPAMGPDIRIDAAVAGAQHDFLEQLSDALMAGYPAASSGIKARIARIDIYEPPYLQIGGVWTRYGIATVKVIARIVRSQGDVDDVLAERIVKAVVNEVPYATPFGPIHSCGSLTMKGPLSAHWGVVTATDDVHLDADHEKIPASVQRETPAAARIDLLWPHLDPATFGAYRGAIEGRRIEDPWLRVLAGSTLGPVLPSPPTGLPVANGTYPSHETTGDGNHSNLFRDISLVGCPDLDYEMWKTIATSGREGVEYWSWVAGSTFRRDGVVGTDKTFQQITHVDPANPDHRPAILFFDTKDGFAPHDDNNDGLFDNLTPAILVSGAWAPRGVIYLNADSLKTAGILGVTEPIRPPAEPFADVSEDGIFDAGEGWINLSYASSLDSSTVAGRFFADAANDLQDDGSHVPGSPVRNEQGPEISADVSLDGILYSSGAFDVTGPGLYYGSVIAHGGVTHADTAPPAVQIYWNDAIRTGKWPPRSWGLPRVVVTRWETDL